MNDSFEVILNQQEYQTYKHLQKEAEATNALLRDLRRDNENYKIKCDQQHLTIRAHQLKIKELSRNSIRLSRRLLTEQEQHFITHDAFLAREKELLEKLLALSTHHHALTAHQQQQEAVGSLQEQRSRQLSEENAVLRHTIQVHSSTVAALTQNCQALSEERQMLREEIKGLASRCSAAEQQFRTAEKDCAQAKALHKLISAQVHILKQQRETQQRMMIQLEQQRIRCLQALTAKQHDFDQLSEDVRALKKQAIVSAQQVVVKNDELIQKQAHLALLHEKNQALLQKNQALTTKHQKAFQQLARMRKTLSCLSKDMSEHKQIAKQIYQNQGLILKESVKKLMMARGDQGQFQEGRVLEAFWRRAQIILEGNLAELRRDQIKEEEQVLKEQLRHMVIQLATSISQSAMHSFHLWRSTLPS